MPTTTKKTAAKKTAPQSRTSKELWKIARHSATVATVGALALVNSVVGSLAHDDKKHEAASTAASASATPPNVTIKLEGSGTYTIKTTGGTVIVEAQATSSPPVSTTPDATPQTPRKATRHGLQHKTHG